MIATVYCIDAETVKSIAILTLDLLPSAIGSTCLRRRLLHLWLFAIPFTLHMLGDLLGVSKSCLALSHEPTLVSFNNSCHNQNRSLIVMDRETMADLIPNRG